MKWLVAAGVALIGGGWLLVTWARAAANQDVLEDDGWDLVEEPKWDDYSDVDLTTWDEAS